MSSVRGVRHQASASSARGLGGLFFGSESTEVVRLAVRPDTGFPCAALPTDAPICRGSVRVLPSILRIPTFGKHAQIRPPVVEGGTVNVIHINTLVSGQAEQFPMQPNQGTASRRSNSVAVAIKAPSPLSGPLSVISVDQGVGANTAVMGAERDASGTAVRIDFKRFARLEFGASHRAVNPMCSRRRPGVRLATRRTGNIYTHRLSPSGGVMPPAVDAARGFRASIVPEMPPGYLGHSSDKES